MSTKSDAIVADLQTLRTEWNDEAQNHTPMGPDSIRERYDDAIEHLDAIIVHVGAGEDSLSAARLGMMYAGLAATVLSTLQKSGPGN